MSQLLSFPHNGEMISGTVQKTEYVDGHLAVQFIDEAGELYATLSVNIPAFELAAGEFIFKNYSENEGLLEALVSLGVVQRTGKSVMATFVHMPVCRLC